MSFANRSTKGDTQALLESSAKVYAALKRVHSPDLAEYRSLIERLLVRKGLSVTQIKHHFDQTEA